MLLPFRARGPVGKREVEVYHTALLDKWATDMRNTFNEQQESHATAFAYAPTVRETPNVTSLSVEECFRVWQKEVTPGRQECAPIRYRPLRPLTPEEVTDVSIATLRESRHHRRWPKDVVEKFLSASVIREPAGALSAAASAADSSLASRFLGATEGRVSPISALIR